uniref:EB domain-containing protein n=1 Tax=Trichuris muris TaxID=70415 RepID=A0A5S6QN87_TRIMR
MVESCKLSVTLISGCKPLLMSSSIIIFIIVIAIFETASGCLLHQDCVAAEALCFDTFCLAATRLSGNCTRAANCKTQSSFKENAGTGCRDNKCYVIQASKLCNVNPSCNDAEVCIRSHCVPAVATSSKCFIDVVCGIGRRCLGGVCYEPQEPSRMLQVLNS